MRDVRRRYAFAGFFATLVAVAALVVISLNYERSVGGDSQGWTLRGIIVAGVLFGLPMALTAAAAVFTGKAGTALRWVSAGVLLLLVPFLASAGGLFLLPAALLMLMSASRRSGQNVTESG